MELLNGLKERRSIRKYQEEEISIADIEKIVDVARYAPTWKNTQTARYNLVLNKETIVRIADEAVMDNEWNQNIIKGLSALVIQTTVDKRSGYERDGSFTTSKGTHWQSYDAGLSGEAFCLAAHEFGYGTLIMGIFDEAKIKEIVSIPEGESVSALIAIGHANEEPSVPKRKEVSDLLRVIE
ncbi:MAG: nitroreductase family protein [Butyrivibrio sp.]|nr:nitroreductase family protein [Butyrivibrio sp.]